MHGLFHFLRPFFTSLFSQLGNFWCSLFKQILHLALKEKKELLRHSKDNLFALVCRSRTTGMWAFCTTENIGGGKFHSYIPFTWKPEGSVSLIMVMFCHLLGWLQVSETINLMGSKQSQWKNPLRLTLNQNFHMALQTATHSHKTLDYSGSTYLLK